MNRLYEISYNEDQWDIKESQSDGYTLIKKSTQDSFNLGKKVVGIEQIADDNFLINKNVYRDDFKIYRMKISGSNSDIEFEQYFNRFFFITDDTILFDNIMIYSISKNSEIDFKYKFMHLDVYHDEKTNRNLLYVEKVLPSSYSWDFVLVFVDCESLKPVSDAYSTLRGKSIPLSDDFTFEDLIKEDENYLLKLNCFRFDEDINALIKGKDLLISQF